MSKKSRTTPLAFKARADVFFTSIMPVTFKKECRIEHKVHPMHSGPESRILCAFRLETNPYAAQAKQRERSCNAQHA